MKPFVPILLCAGLLACSHDKPPESAYERQEPKPAVQAQTLASESDERLTPASGVGEARTTAERTESGPGMGSNNAGIDQGDTEADMVVTRDVRESLLGDPSLSFTAKSVTIVTRDGRVTLRGMVNTIQERGAIERIARQAPGVRQVDNELGVMTE
jgi:osmotically-inducible protein OsmY